MLRALTKGIYVAKEVGEGEGEEGAAVIDGYMLQDHSEKEETKELSLRIQG